MMRKRLTLLLLLLPVVFALLSNCAPPPQETLEVAVFTPTSPTSEEAFIPSQDDMPLIPTKENSEAQPPVTSSAAVEGTPTASVMDQPAAEAEPTPDTRRSPDDWRSWPVLPERVSQRAREIYQRGLAMGNDPHAFSITGDCQAIRDVMLGEFDDPRKYTLKKDETYLQETIDWFQGSFNRNGAAVRGGFNAASVLSPIHADPEYCQAGETPLGCEFRLHNPSILIISLEVWNDRAHLERYELYLRQIIEYSIEEGVLPVMMTKADMAEALRHVINPLLVQLAYEYDLPLANFWLAVQPLPDHGIDPERDGFHISEEAWWVKSLTALKALDVVWRGVSQQEQAAGLTPTLLPTAAPEPTATAAAAPSQPTPAAICSPGDDCVLFDLTRTEAGRTLYEGIFLLNLGSGEITQVAGAGYRLQALAPEGSRVLVNHGDSLGVMDVDGANQEQITHNYLDTGYRGAVWLDRDSVALMDNDQDGAFIRLHDLDSGEEKRLTAPGETPVWLYPSPFSDRVYWESGECARHAECTPAGLWVTEIGGASRPISGVLQPAFSPDGAHYAFMDPQYTFEEQFGANFRLAVEELEAGLPSRRLIAFPPANGFKVRNRLDSYAWSPDGSQLMILLDERSYYYGKSAGYQTYLFKLEGGMLLAYERLFGESPRMAWAPDGQRILFAVTEEESGAYTPALRLLELAARSIQAIPLPPEWSGPQYSYIDRLFWIGRE